MPDHHHPGASATTNHLSDVIVSDLQHPLSAINLPRPHHQIRHRLHISVTKVERALGLAVHQARPESLREFDQIPMNPYDHVRQIKLIASYLAGQSVVFMGDSDCASLLLGLLGAHQGLLPRHMLVLDFDERLLQSISRLAERYSFGHLLETRLYNAFEPLPADLIGQFDWFYTNPPYGSHNQGASARLFVTRCCELTRPDGQGCIILPHDCERRWTQVAMVETQRFLITHGWTVGDKVRGMHRYLLDDDRHLTSSLILVEHVADVVTSPMPYAARHVPFREIQRFYGRTIHPPYPRYIRSDGTLDFSWPRAKAERRG